MTYVSNERTHRIVVGTAVFVELKKEAPKDFLFEVNNEQLVTNKFKLKFYHGNKLRF